MWRLLPLSLKLSSLNRELIARAEAIGSARRVVLDMDSSEIRQNLTVFQPPSNSEGRFGKTLIGNAAPTEQAKVNQNPDTTNLPVGYLKG